MQPLGWLNSVWVLAITWGVSASACTLQGRRRAPRPRLAPGLMLPPRPLCRQPTETLPSHCEANQGQSAAQVQFLACRHVYSLFLTFSDEALDGQSSTAPPYPRQSVLQRDIGDS